MLTSGALAQTTLQFLPKVDYQLSEAEPRDITVGDFNNDGRLDLVVANSANGTDAVGSVDLLLGNGQGGYNDQRTVQVGPKAWAVCSGDFNGDGKLDLAIAEGGQTAPLTKVYLGTGTGSFTLAASLTGGSFPIAVATGDFNADGKLDLAVAFNVSGGILVYTGNGAGGFSAGVAVPNSFTNGTDLAAADINGDGRPDLIESTYGGVTIFVANGAGGFTYNGIVGSPNLVESVVVGDVNGDSVPDLATAEIYTGMTTIYLNNGAGTFTQSHRVYTGGFVLGVAMADFNRDGLADVVSSNQDQNTVSILLNLGNGTFAPKQDFSTGLQPSAVAAGDWNGDGYPDIAAPFRNLGDAASVSVLLQLPSNADTVPPSAPTGLRSTTITRDSASLAWNASTDNVGVVGYKLYEFSRRQWVLRVDGITGLAVTVSGLKANSTHQYAVAAYDAAGNVSAFSASLKIRTLR